MDTVDELSATLKDLLEAGDEERLRLLLAEAHPADLARVLRELPDAEQSRLFRLLSRDQAGAVLHELDDETRQVLLPAVDEAELSGILDQMPVDNAAEVVEELPAERMEKILDLMMGEQAEEVQELLQYGEKTAGRLMSPRFVAVHEEDTVAEAIEHVRQAVSADQVFYLYVLDPTITSSASSRSVDCSRGIPRRRLS